MLKKAAQIPANAMWWQASPSAEAGSTWSANWESLLAGISVEVCNYITALINIYIWTVAVVSPGGRNQFCKVPSRNLLTWNWPWNRLWIGTWGCRLRSVLWVISSDSELYLQAGILHFAFPKDILPPTIITSFLLLCDLPLFSPCLQCPSQSRYIWCLCLCCL